MPSKSATGKTTVSTEGRRDCYVMMPLKPSFEKRVLAEAIDPALEEVELNRLGPRLEPMDGKGVFDQIRSQIEQAHICIADLTGNNANVTAELGIAIALSKVVILITQDKHEKVAFDFSHLCSIAYSLADLSALKSALIRVLSAYVGNAATDRRLLQQMLAPKSLEQLEEGKSVIAASPLSYREARRLSHDHGFAALRRTSSDNVGVRGLLRGFGAIFGLNFLPELLNPGDYRDDVLTNGPGFNLYTIGSPKANHWTGVALAQMNKLWEPELKFVADPESKDLRDVRVLIHRHDRVLPVHNVPDAHHRNNQRWDYGFILRAPNPFASNSMLMILAGRSALGTQAACMVATEAEYLRKLNSKLVEDGIDLDDHRQPFFAVVHMSVNLQNQLYEPDPATLVISYIEKLRRKDTQC